MTTTAQAIIDRARAFDLENASTLADRAELLSRIRADQQDIFTQLADVTRDVFQTTAAITSTSGSSGRSFDLGDAFVAAPNPPVESVLVVTLVSGAKLNRVDILNPDAEFAPRYYVRGKKLIEVSNDWGASGAISATLAYVYGATSIDPAGALTQLVTIPDEWVDLLVLPLVLYGQQKAGKGGDDTAKLLGAFNPPSGRRGAFRAYLTNFGGTGDVSQFVIP